MEHSGGIFAGYNHQLDNGLVLGIEGDINWGGIKATGEAIDSTFYTSTTKFGWTGSGRARVGYAMDSFLPYLTGGVAAARMKFEERAGGDFYSEGAKTLTGWTIGAGAEYAIDNNWTMRGEYRYTQYGTKDFVADLGGSTENWTSKIRTHDLRFGVAYKF